MVQVLDLVPVLFRHVIALEAVLTVTGNGHVVDAEGLVVDELGHRHIDHFQIAFRPGALQLQAAVPGQELIVAQMGMGGVAVVEILQVVVVGGGMVAAALGGDQARQVGKFTGGGAGAPGGLVIFGELDALVCHPVEGGGQLRVDDFGGEGLCGD